MASLVGHSLLTRTALVVLATFITVATLAILATMVITEQRQHKAAGERLERLLDTVESTVSVACYVRDAQLAKEVAQGLRKNHEVEAVAILTDAANPSERILVDTDAGGTASPLRLVRDVRSPFDSSQVVGQIRVDANLEVINAEVTQEVRYVTLLILAQLILVAVTLVGALLIFIVRPIQALSDGLHRMDPTRGERLAMPPSHAHSEIGRLVDDINELAGNLVQALHQERDLRLEMEIGERKYHSIFENAETGIFLVDATGQLTSWNPAFARLFAIPASEPHGGGLNLRQLPWENRQRIVELALNCQADASGLASDLAIRTGQGERRWLNVMLTAIGDGQVQGVVHDITEHLEAEAQARRMAVTDPLTGVRNRLGLEQALTEMITTQRGGGPGFTLALVDLDHFRRINEGFGLPVGDNILKDATQRINHCVKASDLLARLGGDRFALVLPEVVETETIDPIMARLQKALAKPFVIEDTPLQMHASLGITLCPRDGCEIPRLLRNAELALDRVKASGGNNRLYYDPSLAEAAEFRRQMENDLRQAIRQGEFELFLQPIIDLERNRTTGAEDLIRWRHPKQGLVQPDTFIPLAEETGLIEDIGLWALDTACRQLAEWQRAGHDRYLSLNVSGRQIPSGLPPTRVTDAVARHGVEPGRLALEITEGVLLADTVKALSWLNALRERGFRIYLDDFGTGYSSLSYLKRFPVDTLKVDKSFVRDMNEDGSDRALIEAVVAMARGLGMNVVAEGVENAAQLDLLRAMTCRYAQGYHFSRPVPADQFDAAVREIEARLGRHD